MKFTVIAALFLAAGAAGAPPKHKPSPLDGSYDHSTIKFTLENPNPPANGHLDSLHPR
ncbi:hypothetical protein EG328_005196 [Venturia inaequalis]|uniref:Uncharacterized protein n=1 Tax=Venturia inaequalis TaxID=5025 RepID=A0A8H3VFI1_VENIN|nr:hypothetical protein EG328_005196 [Venturia inaequalis]